AVVLLITAGLLIRSFIEIRQVHPGFDARNVLTLRMSLTGPRFDKPEEVSRVVHEGLRRIRAVPGVESAAAATGLPLEAPGYLAFRVAGGPGDPAAGGTATFTRVSPDYFDTFKIPVVRGRTFTQRDESGPPVVIVNQTLARQFWPNSDPLHERLTIGYGAGFEDERPRQIVGVVGDIHAYRLNR